ncbi:MAG: hypothetical protein IJ062_10580 [Firmicutes bacterium]|nr:hypothetical protein [Bacillota bacterium]
MDENIYRKKSIERISSPEELNDFLKVARPSVWLVLGAIIILITGAALWASASTVHLNESDGSVSSAHPIEFVLN